MRFPFILIITLIIHTGSFAQQIDNLDAIKRLEQTHPDSALILLRKAHTAAIEKNDEATAGICLQQMGQICFLQGHYAQALEFHLHADKIFRTLNNPDLQAENLGDMGLLSYYNKQPKQAREYYNRSFSLYKQSRNLRGQAEMFGSIGHLYEKRQQYDSAFYYQNKALEQYDQAGYRQGKAKIYENLGSIYEDLTKYDLAYNSFQKSIEIYQQDHDLMSSIEVINNLGDILRKTNRYTESVVQSRKALAIATSLQNLYQQAAACNDLAKAYQLMNQPDSAYHYLELSRKHTIEVYSKDGINQTAFLQVLYNINKQNDEILRLTQIRKVNRIITIAGLIVFLLLMGLVWVIFSRQRLKIRDQANLMNLELKNKQLREEGLKQELELKSKELSAHTLNLIRNNQFLEELRNTLQMMVKDDRRDQKKQMQQLIQQINQSFNNEQHWKEFTTIFEQVHQRFFDNLKKHSNDLTAADIRLIALLKINLDSKNISVLLGISDDSLRVARYRLRKKLNLDQGDNLSAFIQSL